MINQNPFGNFGAQEYPHGSPWPRAAAYTLAEIVVVLDRSGSMATVRSEMENGLRGFVAEQQRVPGQAAFTLVKFDDHYEVAINAQPLERVQPWAIALEPRGRTALYDAQGRSIRNLEARLLTLLRRPDRIVFVTVSDGYENASVEFRAPGAVAALIRNHPDWQFVYMGCNQDAIEVGRALGYQPRATMTYAANAVGISRAYESLSSSIATARTTDAPAEFTAEDRDAQTNAGVPPTSNAT